MKMKTVFTTLLIALSSGIFSQTIITTVAGTGTSGSTGNGGQSTLATCYNPHDVCLDAAGNLYVSDDMGNTVRKINTAGVISLVAGNGVGAGTATGSFSGDGASAVLAGLDGPRGIAVDAAGNLYIADTRNQRIRMVNSAGIISTIAGTGAAGYTGDGGLALSATFSSPIGIAIDASGNIFVADRNNSVVRKINTSGIISTYAGTTSGYSGDNGPATSAKLNTVYGIAFDGAGNLFIADEFNYRIRKVNTSGTITTIAGTGSFGSSGDGASALLATLHSPIGIAVDGTGNIYFSDAGNYKIRVINSSGIISTYAGVGTYGFSGDGGSPLLAQLKYPNGIALDGAGNLYIGDWNNNRVRKIGTTTGINFVKEIEAKIKTWPNPGEGNLNIEVEDELNATGAPVSITVRDLPGKELVNLKAALTNGKTEIDISSLPAGIYFLQIELNSGSIVRKIIKE